MPEIKVLDSQTIDKIAAGEVVERPLSVVKELVENAIDARADAITVEIKEGGISYIRVTDNGCGIEKAQIPTAFLRHATSKIHVVEDLLNINSLGFRGEALSSIAAVAQVELLTKTKASLTGSRYVIEGTREKVLEDVGIPEGTTFIVRNLFFNTPARRKFLKSAMTEGSYITELMEHIMLSHPEIAFKFLSNGAAKLQTSGNHESLDVIYQIYGRDVAANIVPLHVTADTITIEGFVGKPELARSNRNFEIYYVNKRYIKSTLISRALDEAYKSYLMLHKYPLVALYITIPSELLDINVHPTKMEIRFLESEKLYQLLVDEIKAALSKRELIPEISETAPVMEKKIEPALVIPEPFEVHRKEGLQREGTRVNTICEPVLYKTQAEGETAVETEVPVNNTAAEQMNLFEEKFLSKEAVKKHRIIGQVFHTYWLVEMEEKLYMIDQHAAHEKVMYERLIKSMAQHSVTSQMLNPPIILSLSKSEEDILKKYFENFTAVGFEIEHFGGSEYSLRAVPTDLFGLTASDYFHELLDSLAQDQQAKGITSINDRIATMACKSAVKGNNLLSFKEAEELIDELLTLDNPYNCPHGRPTIIAYSRYELEKKFKRII